MPLSKKPPKYTIGTYSGNAISFTLLNRHNTKSADRLFYMNFARYEKVGDIWVAVDYLDRAIEMWGASFKYEKENYHRITMTMNIVPKLLPI